MVRSHRNVAEILLRFAVCTAPIFETLVVMFEIGVLIYKYIHYQPPLGSDKIPLFCTAGQSASTRRVVLFFPTFGA